MGIAEWIQGETVGTRDVRLLAMAVRGEWPVTPTQRELALQVLTRVLVDPSAGHRAKVAAAKALMDADKVNLKADQLQQENKHHHERLQSEQLDRIAAVAQQLGLTRVVDAIATERPGSDSIANVSAGGAATGHSGTR